MIWWIILSIPCLLLIALCLPLTVTLTIQTDPDFVVEGGVGWTLWRSKRLRYPARPTPTAPQPPLTTGGGEPKPAPTAQSQPAQSKPKAKRKAPGKAKKQERIRLPLATIKQLLQKYLSQLWRALHLRCPRGEIYLAVPDPAVYGRVFGFLGATQLPPRPIPLRLELEHEFSWRANLELRSRLYPIQWLWLLLHIAFEPEIRTVWWSMLWKKGEKKRARSQSVHRAAGESHLQQDSHRRSHLRG